MGDKSKGKEKKKMPVLAASRIAAQVALAPSGQLSPTSFKKKLSKATRRANRGTVEISEKRKPGEHQHRCPACGEWYSHIDAACPNLLVAFYPCENSACHSWVNRPVSLLRPERKRPTSLAIIPKTSEAK